MKLNFQLLERYFNDISALDALEILCTIFNASSANIQLGGMSFALVDLYDYASAYYGLPATDVVISFYGGPQPGRWWYNSNLYTMLLDHILYSMSIGDKKKVAKALKTVSLQV